MQLKATKLAAILSRLRLAPLALFAALGLALAAPQTAQAGNYYKFTFLRVKANPTGSGIAGKELAISELALYDASMNRINLNLTKYTSTSPDGIGVNQFNISHAEMQGSDGALFNDRSAVGSEKWFVKQDIASVKPYVVMRLADDAAPAVFYNLASADSVSGYNNRLPAEWIVEYSTDCSSWQELDHRNLDDSQLPTSDRTWYAGAGAQVANTAPKTCFLLQSQYTPVTYINAQTRGPALQITGFHLQRDDRVETKVQFNDVATTGSGASNHTIFCNRDAEAANSFSAFLILNKFRYDRSTAGTEAKTGTVTSGKDYVIEAKGNTLTAKGNGGSITVENTIDNLGPSSDLLLYGHNNSVSGGSTPLGKSNATASLARMKMYYFKVYDSSGNIRLDLVPVKNGNGVAGMYDRVSGNFYSSVTGDEFTAGPDIEFTSVQYIKATRQQSAINTGYYPNPKTWMEVSLKFDGEFRTLKTSTHRPDGTTGSFFGTLADSNNIIYSANFGGDDNQENEVFVWAEKTSSASATKSMRFDLNNTVKKQNTITFCNGSFKWGDETLVPLNKTTTCTNPLYILGAGTSSGPQVFGDYEMYVYSWKIYESNDGQKGGANQVLLHDYVPVMSSVGDDPGLRDLVTGIFYSSTSDTPFEASEDPDPQKQSIAAASVTYSPTSAIYDGSAHQPTLTVNLNNVDITSECDIAWDKFGFINAGTYTPTITAKSSSETYTGTVSNPGSFTINRKQITKPTAVQNLVYNGSQQTGVASGTGYTVTDGAKTNAGDYTASVSLSDKTNTEWADTHDTADQDIPWSIAKKMAATPVAVVTTYNGSTQDAPIKGASGNMLTEWKLKSNGQHAGSATADETHSVTVELKDTNNYTYTGGETTAGYNWTITHVICTCSTYSTWTAGANNILLGLVPTVAGCGVGNESTAGVAVLTDGANPIPPENNQRTELKGPSTVGGADTTTFTWDLGGQATVFELRVFVGLNSVSWGHANINITKLEYYDAAAGSWKELKFAQKMPYYVSDKKEVSAVISRDNGNLFENATQLRMTMSAPITISGSSYYSSLTEIEAIGEVHASPIPEANLPRLEPQRTFKYDNKEKTVSLSDDTYVQIVSGDGTGNAAATAAGVYYVWVQPKPGYVWPDDESSAPRKYEWGIVPSDYAEPYGADRSFLKTLENSPYRVAASALPPGITGGDIILRFPNPGGDSHDFVHVYTNTAATGFVFENSSGSPRQGRVLLVGGGGGSGSYEKGAGDLRKYCNAPGGGGGGGVKSIRDLSLLGAYSIVVGAGGAGGSYKHGENGKPSSIASAGWGASAGGGGGGARSGANDSAYLDGYSGATGGGGSGYKSADADKKGNAGTAIGYDGYDGGLATYQDGWLYYRGGAGGGAGAKGPDGGASGGLGFLSDILWDDICFGGGGCGGVGSDAWAPVTCTGGLGGGGGNYKDASNTIPGRVGVSGLGGGGGAPGYTTSAYTSDSGRRGGDGIVIIRYTDTVQAPKIKTVEVPEVPSFVYNHELQDTGICDTEDYTVSDDVTGMYIQEYTITLTLRDPDNMQWSDGTTQPQHIKWYIRTDYNVKLGSFYYGLSTNHTRVASDPANLNADFIFRQRVGEEYRYVNIFTNNHASVTIPSMTADILLIGGGGGGGAGLQQAGGGGGGAGGVVLKESQTLSGVYSITIGAGGSRGSSGSAGGNGGETYLSLGDSQVSGLIAHGGGGGAGGNEGARNGKNGASGGGAAGVAGVTTMTAGQCNWPGEGYDGGLFESGAYDPYGGGGGGAGAPGGRGVGGSGQKNGGNGVSLPILGYNEYFGGGGAGQGGVFDYEQVKGGLGGGGNGVWRGANPEVGDGMDGQGGGGGSSGYNSQATHSVSGGRGGCGLVVIVYSRAAGLEIDEPVLTKGTHTFTGSAIDVTDSLTSKDHLVFNGTWSATNVGTYTFTAQPEDGYCWTGTVIGEPGSQTPIAFEWSIAAKPIQGNITVSPIPAQTYTGSAITPALTVTDAELGRTLVNGTDYTAEYVGNVNIGTATIKLTGTGNYTGVETATFQIVADPNVTGYFVTADADGSGDGTGWASPFTFQQALTAVNGAAVGTTNAIYMKVGTYTNTSGGPWTATPNKRCFIHVLGGYLGVNLARSTTEYTVLDGEGERGLVSVTVNISQSSTDHGKWILFDQIKFYRGKRAYYINVADGKGNYFSRFVNCRFIDNIAPAGDTNIRGSAIEVKGMSLPWVENCEFRGNKACTQYATTIFAAEPVSNWYYGLTLMNSLFVGNSSKVRPCVAHFGASENNNITIKSCTFAYNAVATEANREGSYATGANGGLVLDQRDYNGSTYIWDMTDTIFYGNRCNGKTGTDYRVEKGSNVKGQPKPQYLLFEKATAYVEEETTSAYADVDPNARHYIFGDPLFVTPLPAAVEFDANYNPTWYADSAKTVTVSPADMDVHLQSTKGRWDGTDWVCDDNYSPAIDAGNPESEYSLEPTPNGGRINLGAYGNTAEASKSYDVTEEAATLSGAAGLSEVKQLDNGHTVLIFSNVTDAASFTVAEGGVARILVVGGGGNGGGGGGSSYGGGGGGAGGVVERSAVMLSAGTYTVVVGGSHQDSVLKDSSGTALITAYKGGNGGQGSGSAGENGGSGGGAGGHLSINIDGGTGFPGQGNDGGSGRGYTGRGGGGYSESGNVGTMTNGGAGGGGYVSDITGEMRGYACGGGGGGSSDDPGGAGGCVTINGVRIKLGGDGTNRAVAEPGVAGTGSGGGGSDTANAGGRGGSGIVVVHLYSAWTPQFNVTLDPNGGTGGKTSVTATYGEDMPTLDEGDLPARDGYKFAGYSREGWEVKPMTGNDADFIDEGESKWAFTAYAGADQTVNGTTFVKSGLKKTSPNDHGIVDVSPSFTTDVALNNFGDNFIADDFTGCDGAYKNVLIPRVEYQDADDRTHSITFTLKRGLTANKAYAVQITSYQRNEHTVTASHRLGISEDVYYGTGYPESPKGISFVYRFVATNTAHDVTLYKPLTSDFRISSVQLRELGDASVLDKYYNDDGTSAKPWDILGDATLYAQWTKSVVSVARPTQGTASWTYDGQDHRPAYADTEGYTVAYSADAPWKNAGTYKVTFTLRDNCEWADGTDVTSPIEFTYTITQREVTLGWGSTSLTYNRTAQAPTCTAGSLVSGDSCTVTVSGQQTNVGTGYTATATGLSNSNYKLPSAKTTTFSIAKKALTVEGLKATDRPYDGTTAVAITGGTLVGVIAGDDVTCEMPRSGTIADANVGTGKPVTYPALTLGESSAGNYSVERPSLTVNITQATITKVTLTSADATYDGLPHQPQVASVTANGKTFNSAITGWDVSYSRNDYTSVGTITVTATGKANLTGSASTSFTITAKALTDTMVMLSASSFVYNGTNQKPTVTVTDGSKTLVENTDYTLTNAGGTDVGNNYEVQVVGKGNYSGTITKTFAITQAENTWTTVPAISKTTYKANDPATLTPGVPRFGTVAGTIAKDGGAAGTFSGSLPTEVGSYVLTYSVAETQNYTGLSETLNFTVTEAAYDLHAISGTGPEIKDVPSSWLAAAFPTVEKTQEAYQTEFLKVNASGVKAWQAYVLGFEGGQVATAKLVEETVQNADPATVTIRLANMPPLREGTGCTVKYSLYAATSTEDLMNDRGTVVTNDTDINNVKVYEKWHESTFEAPLDDLTDDAPVNYYRIKVHFIFSGGGGGGEDEPKATVFYTYLDTVNPDALPSGWTKDAPGSGKDNEYYVRTGPIDIPSACLDDGYVRVSFKTTVKYNGGYFTLTFLDENGQQLTAVDSLKVAVDSLATAENGQLVTKVYRVPAGANVQKIHMQWADSNSARAKNLEQDFSDVQVSNIKVESLNYLAAASEVDAIFGETVDSTAYATAKATYFDARSANADWTRGLQGLHDALVNGGDYNILVMGDSLAEVPFNGAVEALIKRQWPQSNVRVHVCWNNNSGCTQFAGSGYSQQQIPAENKYNELLEGGFAGYNCVIFSGTSQARCASSWLGLSGAITTINNAIKEKNPNCSVVFLAPQLSVDSRYFEPWGTQSSGDYWDTAKGFFVGDGQTCAARTDFAVASDGWAAKDYNIMSGGLPTLTESLGMAYWNLYEFAYDYLFRSGKPYFYYSRDAQHANEYNRVLSAKQLFEVFKLVAAKDFTTP